MQSMPFTKSLNEPLKSNSLSHEAVSTATNDQDCQHLTGRHKTVRMLLNKQSKWPMLAELHPADVQAEEYQTT